MKITVGQLEESEEMCPNSTIMHTQAIPKPPSMLFCSRYSINGFIETESPNQHDHDHSKLLLEWLEHHLVKGIYCVVDRAIAEFHAQSPKSAIIRKSSNFRVCFEDETDAMLFYMTFK